MQMWRFVQIAALGLSLAGTVTPSAAAQGAGLPPPPPPGFPGLMLLEGSGASIGAAIRDVDRSEAGRLKITGGAFVDSVRTNSAAEKAGIRNSDVIVEFDGEHVRSVRQLSRLLWETPAGRPVKVVVLRGQQRVELSITTGGDLQRTGALVDPSRLRDQLGRMREWMSEGDWSGPRAHLGAVVDELTPELAAYFGARQGVLVSAVTDNSPAFRAGLRVGDVMTSIDSREIRSRADLIQALAAATNGQEMTIGIVRDKKQSSLTARVERSVRRRENV